MPRYKYYGEMTISALKSAADDIKAQALAGKMSREEAHKEINIISAVMAQKQLALLESDGTTDEATDDYGFGKEDQRTMGHNHYGGKAAMVIKIASKARHKGEAAIDFIATEELT